MIDVRNKFEMELHYNNLSIIDIKGEIWTPIIGYEGLYEVSQLGRIKSVKKKVKRGEGVFCIKEALIKKQKLCKGYLICVLCKDSIPKHKKVHRLVAKAFIPNPENKPEVNHKKGIKTDNRVSELVWATSKENVQHSYDTKLKFGKKGEIHPLAKLSDADIPVIRNLRKNDKLTHQAIADLFKINRCSITNILNGKYYSHVK